MKALTPQTAKILSPIRLSANDRLSLGLSREGDHFIAYIKQGEHGTPSLAAQKTFPERIPERKRLDGMGLYTWQFAATDVTAAIIDSLWPREQVEFRDQDAKTVLDYLLLMSSALDSNAEVVAKYKERAAYKRSLPMATFAQASGHAWEPAVPVSYELNEEKPLADYQQVALHNCIRSAGYALFKEQGTGKTPVVVAVVCNEAPTVAKREKRMYRAIVVAPKNVRMNWQKEFENFATVQGRVTVLRGGDLNRTKQLIDAFTQHDGDQFSIVVCSYDVMVRDFDRILGCIEWDLAVLDEGHAIKWPKTKRAQVAMKLRDVSKKRLILTGTPVTNHPLDLYSELEFTEKGASGFMSWEKFREFYGVWRPSASGHKALVGLQNLPFLKERLARRSFIITKEEALPGLPEKVYDVIEVEMEGEQRDVYEQVATRLAAEIERDLSSGGNKSLTINNVLTKLLRLAQITSGFVTWDEQWDEDTMLSPKVLESFTVNPKIEALVEAMKEHHAENPDSKVLLWACWRHDIHAIEDRLKKEFGEDSGVTFYGGTSDDDRAIAEERFNCDPTCWWLVGNPGAGGTGLNLIGYPPHDGEMVNTYCGWVVYFSQDWSMVKRAQSEDRAHRRGTRHNVRYTDLCVPGSIDEEIRVRVMKKRTMALTVSDIRDILKNVIRGVDEDGDE